MYIYYFNLRKIPILHSREVCELSSVLYTMSGKSLQFTIHKFNKFMYIFFIIFGTNYLFLPPRCRRAEIATLMLSVRLSVTLRYNRLGYFEGSSLIGARGVLGVYAGIRRIPTSGVF